LRLIINPKIDKRIFAHRLIRQSANRPIPRWRSSQAHSQQRECPIVIGLRLELAWTMACRRNRALGTRYKSCSAGIGSTARATIGGEEFEPLNDIKTNCSWNIDYKHDYFMVQSATPQAASAAWSR